MYNSGLTRGLKILWSDVKDISLVRIGDKSCVSISLRNFNSFLHRQNWITQNILKLNRAMGCSNIAFNTSTTTYTTEETLLILKNRLEKSKAN